MDFLKEIQEQSKELNFNSLAEFKSESQTKTDAWLESRRGKFTASEFHKLMGYEDKDDFPKGAETYALDKAIEILTIREDDNWTSTAMDWGNSNEKEAVETFMKALNLEVSNYGDNQEFQELGDNIGCTPDGLIGTDSGIETKCPNSKTHFQYLKLKDQLQFKKECKNYYWQIQGSMYVTGRSSWYFVSFDPRFKDDSKRLSVLKIERNDIDIDKLKTRLTQAIKKRNEHLKDVA
jgi:hypothetical protein